MIPVRLELKNFMSYGEDAPVLDLTGMHTLCLSGENGNGKSALLDAITWSLWGESRAGKNKHDELVRIGADEMSVQFTFDLDGQRFRVLRKRSKRASGNVWELQQEQAEGAWRSLTGNNSGETERAIQKLLRMSYDTFINSAYLRQGQADRFVQQSPGKRKEILADILDLSRYDQLEAKAREKAREAMTEVVDAERDINGMSAELASEAQYRESLAALQARYAELEAKQEVLKKEWDDLRDRRGQLESQREFAERVKAQIATLDAEIVELTNELTEQNREADRWKAILVRKDEIERDHALLVRTREDLGTLEENVAKLHRGRQMLADAEKEWLTAQNEMHRKLERATIDYQQALGRIAVLPDLQREHAVAKTAVAGAESMEAERQTAQARLTVVRENLSQLQQDNAAVGEQIKQWESRLAAIADQQGVCSVCNSPLPPEKIAETQREYQDSLAASNAQRKTIWAQAKQTKEELAALERQVTALDQSLTALTADRVRLGQLEQRLLELEEVQRELPQLEARATETKALFDAKAYAPEILATVTRYRDAIAKLGDVEAAHAAARETAARLAPVDRQHLELAHAAEALAAAESRLQRADRSLRQRRDARDEAMIQQKQIADVSSELAALDARANEIKVMENERRQSASATSHEIGRYQQLVMRCEDLKAQKVVKEAALLAAKKEQEIHDQLAKAFGKKGVQALIIENAIPEIQEEANRLLERLTDGDMTIYFETLREAKSKKDTPIETLDIKVSDSLGTRPLEMYSGGEGFRAAFALRIALSKLLARRAGAKLQTLIIDEGFGTQDGKGRERLVDALNAIKEDFEKIIVITHIDELKDAFASRVEIVKTPMGSQITIMEGASG
ncbi:hypothetical protein CCAX7_37840 [Capsulimonas corticalis]|uniref:Nuclease SbcCD subunit C n=1 Tax=Capsulimonas corticalis TaxID=2219043 RepID=A0A402D149_9BACT|nr:SMC family ATPase [Capsulimonas corticalis]BDI31733.1 hypothetical protein CCAX7_37840 [Capsulimonas corticalis]